MQRQGINAGTKKPYFYHGLFRHRGAVFIPEEAFSSQHHPYGHIILHTFQRHCFFAKNEPGMRYSESNNLLRSVFTSEKKEIIIPGSGVRILNAEFFSGRPAEAFFNSGDLSCPENDSFSYPVFVPRQKESKNVILLLHGLNERSWLKYLSWAYTLSESTGSYVILFPISFHINRSPKIWRDPRIMSLEVQGRLRHGRNIQMLSFANVALSKRLTEDPRRFFFSGYRTAVDVIRLLESIRDGNHQIIPKTSEFNIFSYSIGAFLSEILMMANPGELFSGSKLFILCGGSVFSRMQGTSKLIMDSLAFRTIFGYYMKDFEESVRDENPLADFFRSSSLGLVFRSMIDMERLKGFREKILREIRERISIITLMKDQIIPPRGIIDTMDRFSRKKVVGIADFPFEYSHENPFPVSGNSQVTGQVDSCFESVMMKAAEFLG